MQKPLKHVVFFCLFGLAVAAGAQSSLRKQQNATNSAVFYQAATLDINRVMIKFNNLGYLDDRDRGAAVWPKERPFPIIYDQGLWVIGKINEQRRLALSMWSSSYSPGPIIDGKAAMLAHPEDSVRYRVYKISRFDEATNKDRAEWPVDLGAPVDALGRPKLLGDQMLWTVYNGADPAVRFQWSGQPPLLPMPVEIQQTAFAQFGARADSSRLLTNVVFIEWMIINKGNDPIDSTYVSLWTDIDFAHPSSNPPAVDTLNQVGYCWYGEDSSPYTFGTRVPAIGYVWLYGPSVPAPGNNAVFLGRKKTGYKNLPITSFWGIQDDGCYEQPLWGHACSISQAWNLARGLGKSGEPIIDPTTGRATKFTYSGDPVTNTGWIHRPETGGGAGFNIFSGPFTLAPNDTQWVMVALVPAKGANRFDSIQRLREQAQTLRATPYDSLAKSSGRDPRTLQTPLTFKMYQNYPNPLADRGVRKQIFTSIDFDFEASQPMPTQLKIFDIHGREVATLVNEVLEPKYHQVFFDASNLPSGIYFYRLQIGEVVQTKRFVLMR